MKTALAFALGLLLVAQNVGGEGNHEKVEPRKCTLKVSGMTCAGCEVAVRLAARSVEGVQDVTVSYAKGKADVTYDPRKTSPAAIARVITKKSGFTAEPLPPPGKGSVVKED
jgi:copper chaperone CopZ